MLKRLLPIVAVVGVITLAAGLLAGVAQLCVLRFRAGDVYPPLSSLRADPVGAKAFHDSLREVEGLTVERSYRPLDKLVTGSRAAFTLFWLGDRIDRTIELNEWQDLLQLAAEGGRVVLAFAPEMQARTRDLADQPKPGHNHPAPTPGSSPAKATPTPAPKARRHRIRRTQPGDAARFHIEWVSFEDALKRVGIQVKREARWERVELQAHAEQDAGEALKWHGVVWFDTASPRVKTLCRRAKKPVAVEYSIGRGSVVVASDSFFITNEALRDCRAPRWLATLTGGNRRIVFEENHHGVVEQPGIATLIRSYRLEGVFGVLGLLAALYVWKSASPLLPRIRRPSGTEVVAGREAQEGFVNLLHRAIPVSQLVTVCAEEWNAALSHRDGPVELPAAGADPVTSYAAICETLAKRRGKKG